MNKLPTRVWYYGKDEPLPEQIPLRAGPLSLILEDGDLRYIRLGDHEILRRVYVAVRDRNWDTVLPRLTNRRIERDARSFRVTYECEHREGDVDFFWRGTILGDAQGTISFRMEGEARSTFLRNRIGFCVLHPIRECAGRPCRVEQVDGTIVEGAFPRYISPHQPFLEMRAIAHEVAPGVWAEVRFDGDIFEMEDQRNWTDASYKTYCTPLRLPYPVEIRRGTRISQSVTLRLEGAVPETAADEPHETVSITVGDAPTARLPHLGLGVASHGRSLSQIELARLKALNLAHLRVDLRLSRPDYAATLRQAADEARALGVTLEVAIILSHAPEDELRSLVSLLEALRPPVGTWLVFHDAEKSTTEQWVALTRRYLASYDPAAKIGSGTNAYFTELNRGRPPVHTLDLVAYSINPQVHAFDNASLVETLAAQAETVESARQFVDGLPLAITPVTLKPRFNPNATGPAADPDPHQLPPEVDVRQMSLFGAGWTVGSLKYLAESAVASATYYETTGWRGVMELPDGSPLPDQFRSLPGMVYPSYHVFADVGEFAGGEILPTRSSRPLQVDGLALRRDEATRVLLANLSATEQRVRVELGSAAIRVRSLDETNVEEAALSPEEYRARPAEVVQTAGGAMEISLRPFAVVRIDAVRS